MADAGLGSRIRKQVEYYFGDINLPKDTFLKKTLAENDGWMPFETLLKFKRLRQLSTNIDVIKNALAKSDLIEVKEDALRRASSNPAPESLSEALTIHGERALYVKGFPTTLTLDEIISWLESVAGETYDVFCKRFPNKNFKGSVYVTFKEKEAADKFIESSDCAEYKGSPLLRKWYKNYLEDKLEARRIKNEERKKKKDRKNAEVASKMTAGALLEISNLPSLTSKTEESKIETEAVDDSESKPNNDDTNTTDDISNQKTENFTSKAAVTNRTVSRLRSWINETLNSSIPIAWVDVDPIANKAIVRFKESNSAKAAFDKFESASEGNKIVYDGSQVSFRVIEGDEEVDLWRNLLFTLGSKKRKAGKSNGGKFGNKRRRHN